MHTLTQTRKVRTHAERPKGDREQFASLDFWIKCSTQDGKKLLKRVAVLARIEKFLSVKYRIILFNARLNLFVSTVSPFGEIVIQDY